MRATKFDPERQNNSQNARPNGQADPSESDQPDAVQPPRVDPPPSLERRYRSAGPAPAAPAPRPEALRREPPRADPPRRPEVVRPEFMRPEPPRTEFMRPEPARPEFMRPEPARPEFMRPEPARRESARPGFMRPEPARPEPARPEFMRPEPVRPDLTRPEPPRAVPQYRSTAPTAPPSWYRPEPDPPAARSLTEPVYRSTAPPDAPRFVHPPQERRPPDPAPRHVQLPSQRFAGPVEAAPAPRAPATGRLAALPALPALPAPGFARGLPAPALPAPPTLLATPAPLPVPPAPLPAPGLARQARFGPGLPAPAAAPAPRLVSPVATAPVAAPEIRPARPRPIGPLEIDRVRYEDLPAILDLVNADLLPGQPTCGRHALDMAMRGESLVDATWWSELSNVRVAVARRGGSVVGAASYASAVPDRSGWLLWLHAREERRVVEALIDHALAELTGSSHLYAFWIATALTLGVEALPVEQQPVTHELLTSRGLMGRDSWRYLVLPMERFALDDRAEDVAAVRAISGAGEIPAWQLVIGDNERPVASAEIALAGEGCGLLRWIDVEPAHRGRGVGRRLLRQAVRLLALRGAQTVAAFVDHADPRERDPSVILRLLGSTGFHEVDRLWSYESPRKRR